MNGVPDFGSFGEAEAWALAFTNYEALPPAAYDRKYYDLRRVEALLHEFGDPHLSARTVHVAGSKGKGSVAAMTASVLRAAGFRTALYTSPHLLDLRERFQINGELITEEAFTALAGELKPKVEAINLEARWGKLTTFEVLTALAFLWFAREKVDWQVLEVGMGGRLDATNVCRPDVCAITNISLDHAQFLGDTLDKIAVEKAAIIKPGCLAVSAPQSPEALFVIEQACSKAGADLWVVKKDLTWRRLGGDLNGQNFEIKGRYGSYRLHSPLLGEYQVENAAVVVGLVEALSVRGAPILRTHLKLGLETVRWPGRLQVVRRDPLLVLDGAHNGYSAQKLAQALGDVFEYKRCILVCGVSGDKDIRAIVEPLAKVAAEAIVTRSRNPRAADPALVGAEFMRWGVPVAYAEGMAGALALALEKAKKEDLVCVTGSLFIVADALKALATPA
jgi:dihydrofolate synthase/folylpolyglutamate synthase